MLSIHQILLKYWNHSQFRPLQEDIIQSILHGNDTLALLPTGGGKSICFQVPAMQMDGICIVISPLIALMKDQVENLSKRGISACAIYSGMKKNEIDILLDNCVYGKVKFLYLSPERLGSEIVKVRLQKMKISFIAIDEAHCISQWGYDFRPAYMRIIELRENLPSAKILALTATATPVVVKDIQRQLGFPKENVFKASFERKNLHYIVLHEEDKWKRLIKILRTTGGSAIVYARNRAKTQEIADWLNKNDIVSDYYHAGLDPIDRDNRQNNWMRNNVKVMVCTNAFGMGIDKPDVRIVVHLEMPDSLEAYFQEAGRAGRDEKKAYAVLLYQTADAIDAKHKLELNYPETEQIKKVYQALANYYQLAVGSGMDMSFDFDISDFCHHYNFKTTTVYNCLKFLEKEEYLMFISNSVNYSKLKLLMNRSDLYNFQIKNSSFDPLIKTILRSYSGTFDDYITIQESDIARRSEKTQDDIKKQLNYLQRLKVLQYIPKSFLPKIIFIRERIDVKKLTISPENYSKRKENDLQKLDEVIHYASSSFFAEANCSFIISGKKT